MSFRQLLQIQEVKMRFDSGLCLSERVRGSEEIESVAEQQEVLGFCLCDSSLDKWKTTDG